MINSAPENQGSGRKLFYGLFIFPLVIAIGMAVLLCTVVLLTREVETPESLITAIKTGSPSKRWQKAFELSNELNKGRGLLRESGVMKEVIHILGNREEYDAQTRAYMAIALGRFKDPEVVPALEHVLENETDSSVQIYLIWALGSQEDKAAAGKIVPFLASEQEELRKVAVYTLGVLGDVTVVQKIEPLLEDVSRDVKWNAALSLARLGSNAGYDVLVSMVDQSALESSGGLDETRIEEIRVNAVKGLGRLKRSDSQLLLKQLSETDKNLKVRQAAITALQNLQKKL